MSLAEGQENMLIYILNFIFNQYTKTVRKLRVETHTVKNVKVMNLRVRKQKT